MPSENEPSSSDAEQPVITDEDRFERASRIDPGTPKPDEEIQLNLKKFALVLGAILLFALIAGMISQFTGG
jgi:hypothetical protein